METITDKKFNCDKCFFNSNNKTEYYRHLQTKKHIKNTEIAEKNCNERKYECKKCHKKYQSNNGLWGHKKKCNFVECEQNTSIDIKQKDSEFVEQKDDISEEQNVRKILLEKIKMLEETMKKMFEDKFNEFENKMIKNTPNITNNNNINNINNINIFLNENCKDAMNLMDFVKTVVFDVTNYSEIQRNGYVNNKIDLFVEKFNELPFIKRPLHYIKNEADKSIHIKDKNIWKEQHKESAILNNAMIYIDENNYVNFMEKTSNNMLLYPLFNQVKCEMDRSTKDMDEIKSKILEKIEVKQEDVITY
jgi:hypothetical protein